MSNSTDKMDVRVAPTQWQNGKRWVKVTLKRSKTFYPSFEDLHRIIQAVCFCEDEKYPDGKGRIMVSDFLRDCTSVNDFAVLARKYNIPIRDGEKVTETNGAKIINAIKSACGI